MLAINPTFAIWVVGALRGKPSCTGLAGDALTTCRVHASNHLMAVGLLVIFWVVSLSCLALLWYAAHGGDVFARYWWLPFGAFGPAFLLWLRVRRKLLID